MNDWKNLYRPRSQQEDYTPATIDHFMNPRQVGHIDDDDGYGRLGDPGCGDTLEITLRVDEGERIADIRFLIAGCPAAVATGSITAVLALGKTVREAFALIEADVLRALGGLPPEKVHCSLLSIGALRAALSDYCLRQHLLRLGRVRSAAEYRDKRDGGELTVTDDDWAAAVRNYAPDGE